MRTSSKGDYCHGCIRAGLSFLRYSNWFACFSRLGIMSCVERVMRSGKIDCSISSNCSPSFFYPIVLLIFFFSFASHFINPAFLKFVYFVFYMNDRITFNSFFRSFESLSHVASFFSKVLSRGV